VSRTETQLEPTTADCRKGRALARHLDGMPQIVVQYQRSGVQALSRHCGGRRARERRQCRHEMVGERQHVETGLFDGDREVAELGPAGIAVVRPNRSGRER
jgi:hypothetical protein